MEEPIEEKVKLSNKAFKKKVIIITGAAQGIGRSLALLLAHLSGKIVIADISEEGERVVEKIRENDGDAYFIKLDVANEENVEDSIQKIIEKFGQVDILVNNAIICPVSSVEEMDINTWDRTIAVNLRGPFLLIKKLIPIFKDQGEGIIINLLSTGGSPPPEVGQAFMSAYCASKGGLAALTLSLAPELEMYNIKIAGVWVGMTDTPGGNNAFKALAPLLGIPFEQFKEALIPPEYVAATIGYIISNIEDFWGSIVESDELIEELGLTKKLVSQGEVPATPIKPSSIQKVDISFIFNQTVENSENLLNVIEEINESINQLPVFVRPMAKRGFKKKAGADIKRWQNYIEEMIERQKKWYKAYKHENKEILKAIQGSFIENYNSVVSFLSKLKTYIDEVPSETARFTKNEETIREITAISNRQSAVVKSTLSNLEIIFNLLS